MKRLLFSLCLSAALCLNIISALGAAPKIQKMIPVSTDNTQMVFAVTDDGKLTVMHYGKIIDNVDEYLRYTSYRREDYGTEPLAYPASGDRYFNESALAITFPDGGMNVEPVYDSHNVTAEDGAIRTEILLKDKKTSLEVKLIYVAYQKEDVIVAHSEITNPLKKAVTLRNYYSSSMTIKAGKYLLTHFYGSATREFQMESEVLTHGLKSIESRKLVRTTHTENPSFMLSLNTAEFKENEGEVIAGALAWSGNYKLNFQIDESDALTITGGINPYASSYPLKKGQTFITPDMIWTYSCNGAGQASRNLHDWARGYRIYSPETVVPTLLNSWEGAHFTFDTGILTKMIDDAAEMGLEMFVLDDGWFGGEKFPRNSDKQGLGDWDPIPGKVPEGIDYIADYAHQKGIKFGIWIEPEMVNPKSELALQHPDWIVNEEGREAFQSRSQWILDLSNPKVQDFVFGVFDRTMQLSDNIDYIKWDANRHIDNFGSDYLGEEQERFLVEYTQGFYSVMKRIREKYPDVVIQCCSSGGGRVEYGQLKYFNEYWGSDNTDALSRIFIQWGTSMIYPARTTASHVSAIPNKQSKNITPLKFRFEVAATGRLGMELQPTTMTQEEKEFSRIAIKDYQSYRDIVFFGDLYRLNSPYDEDGLCALMFVSKDKKRAVVFTYCTKYQSRSLLSNFKLEGLDEASSYHVRELNVKKPVWWGTNHSFSGNYLMNQGINVHLTTLYDSAAFYLESK